MALSIPPILPPEADKHYPVCLKGKRACPPEDCGGAYGYDELLEILRNPQHPEHEESIDWLGDDFDPEAFDLDDVNERLAHIMQNSDDYPENSMDMTIYSNMQTEELIREMIASELLVPLELAEEITKRQDAVPYLIDIIDTEEYNEYDGPGDGWAPMHATSF